MAQELSEFSLAGVFPDGVKGERVNLPGTKKAVEIGNLSQDLKVVRAGFVNMVVEGTTSAETESTWLS